MRRIKLAAIILDHKDATSLYRGAGPLSLLQKTDKLYISYLSSVDAVTLMHYDLVFMQRPTGQASLNVARLVKDCKLPLWVDFDDYPFAVTADNPMSAHYASKEVMEATEALIRLANKVTVTNDTLREMLIEAVDPHKTAGVYNRKYVVIPNAYDLRFHGEVQGVRDNKKIVWRGGLSHDRDLFEFAPKIKRVLDKNKNWTMEFVGGVPWYIREQFDQTQVKFTPVQDFMAYRKHMSEINASIQIVPLHDSPLSRCRSNIGWIEGTVFGSNVLVPDFNSWDYCVGTFQYNHESDDFEGCLENMIMSSNKVKEHQHKVAAEELMLRFRLEDINGLRMKVIKELCDGTQ